MARAADGSAETELAKERTYGGDGVMVEREIRRVDLSDFDRRRAEIDDALWEAAIEAGFFQVVNHGIPQADVDAAFELAEAFFALPDEVKRQVARPPASNAGWESLTQKRPSTGTLDQKESYQITRPQMASFGLWLDDAAVPSFRSALLAFERANWELAMRLLGSFARKLDLDDDFFTKRHDPASAQHQSTLRLLHYFPLEAQMAGLWRAGAHTDYNCLTLLHQRPGQDGLQVCPGADADADRAGDAHSPLRWTAIEPADGTITCNIGDMLMRWSGGLLPSTLHRVAMPRPRRRPRAPLLDRLLRPGGPGRRDPGPRRSTRSDHGRRLRPAAHRRQLRQLNRRPLPVAAEDGVLLCSVAEPAVRSEPCGESSGCGCLAIPSETLRSAVATRWASHHQAAESAPDGRGGTRSSRRRTSRTRATSASRRTGAAYTRSHRSWDRASGSWPQVGRPRSGQLLPRHEGDPERPRRAWSW